MAKAKTTDELEVVEAKEPVTEKESVLETIGKLDTVPESKNTVTERTFALNKINFTAVGETFMTLCNPIIKIKTSEKSLIKSAEQQVKLGFLKEVK